jgi:hypothetical protein
VKIFSGNSALFFWRENFPLQTPRYTKKQFYLALTVVLITAGLIHLIVGLGGPLLIAPDSSSYLSMAQSIREGKFTLTDMSAERTPGYSAFLVIVENVFGAHSALGLKMSQHLLGVGTQAMVFLCVAMITQRLFFAMVVALAGLTSLQFVAFHNSILTEPFYTFLLMLFVTSFLYALSRGNILAFLVSMAFCGFLAWTRPAALQIWVFPLGIWILKMGVRYYRESDARKWQDRLLQALGKLFSWKALGPIILSILVFVLSIAPILLDKVRHPEGVGTGEMIGVSLWTRVMYWGKHENYHNQDFTRFLDEYREWREKNPEVLKGLDWRHSYVAMNVLSDFRKYDVHQQLKWLKEICYDAVAHNKKEYMVQSIADAQILFGSYDGSFQFTRGAEKMKTQYPWAAEVRTLYDSALYSYMGKETEEEDKSAKYKRLPWAKYFRLYEEKESVFFQSTLLLITHAYFKTLRSEHQKKFLLLLSTGVLAAFLLCQPIEYLFLLGIMAYHSIVPILLLAPGIRYRYPVEGFLYLPMASVPWVMGLLFAGLGIGLKSWVRGVRKSPHSK